MIIKAQKRAFAKIINLTKKVPDIAEEDFGVNVPEWSDFAPTAFVNVKEPKCLGKLNVNSKYWYERKVDFENALTECKELSANDERFSCYEKLKVSQYKLNNDYNARIEAKINATSAIPGMENRTDTMIPIGGYLNNMTHYLPNEIR